MGGGDTTTQTQTSNTGPWATSRPLIESVLRRYSGMDPNETSGQSSAYDTATHNLSGLPNFTDYFKTGIDRLFNTNNDASKSMLSGAYGDLQSNLGGIARGENLDPYSQPGMQGWLDRITNDVTKNVKGTYAASGRDPSGAGSFAGSLGKGLTEGIAPVVANQANILRQNQMDAAKSLYGAGSGTAGGLAGFDQMTNQNLLSGLGQLPSWLASALGQGQAGVGLANSRAGIPWGNLAQLLGGATGLGSLGQDSSGTTNRTQPQNMWSNVIGGLLGGTGILSTMGAFPTGAGGNRTQGWLFSDERLKDDVRKVGMLDDGETGVYSYRYKGDATPRLGLIAQEVEQITPEAVHNVLGFRAVDYAKATEKARHMRGMLDLEAA